MPTLYATSANVITLGRLTGYRSVTTEHGSPIVGLFVNPDIKDEIFTGLEANRMLSLHREALRCGDCRLFCAAKREAWNRNENLPID